MSMTLGRAFDPGSARSHRIMVVVRYRALASVVAFVMTVAVAFIPRAALADESVPPAPAAAPDLAIEAKRRGDDALAARNDVAREWRHTGRRGHLDVAVVAGDEGDAARSDAAKDARPVS